MAVRLEHHARPYPEQPRMASMDILDSGGCDVRFARAASRDRWWRRLASAQRLSE